MKKSNEYFNVLEILQAKRNEQRQVTLSATKNHAKSQRRGRETDVLNLNWNDLDEEYDPFQPNNYEEYLEVTSERMKKLEKEKQRRELDIKIKRMEDERREKEQRRKRELLRNMNTGEKPSSGRGQSLIIPAWMELNRKK
eukprot:snap_masked-scaffold_5-processed-gene-3.5-mRNA-1 protein AED:1.00 eAED:1.00 QI:0/0/0/0/1/1/2/0/139